MELLYLVLVHVAVVGGSTLLYEGKTTAVVEFNGDSFLENVKDSESVSSSWIVVFYAHWCGHCQHFAPEFIRIAETFRHEGANFKFGAIDCAASGLGRSDVCAMNDIRAYPTIFLFRGGEKVEELAKIPDSLEKDVQRLVQGSQGAVLNGKTEVDGGPVKVSGIEAPKERVKDLLVNPQTVKADAVLTMYTILHSEVFKGSTEVLSESEKADLKSLLKLCSSIFQEGPCGSLLYSISGSVPQHREWKELVDSNFPGSSSQSFLSCSDLSCGMWRLLHLISVSASLSPPEATHALRFVVDRYFSCEVCRKHFLAHFDNCDFGRCSEQGSSAAWLVRLHNSVNVRLGHPLWPDNGSRSALQYENSVRSVYGFELLDDPATISSTWTVVLIFLIILAAVASFGRAREALDRLRFSIEKKYQPINIV